MAAGEARISANLVNATSVEGKERSRGGVMLPEDAAAVERRYASFRAELQPSGDLGLTLVRRAATLAVRMEKCSERELVASSERIVAALEQFKAPEGADPAEVARLRAEVVRMASFDPSKEACLARRYEAAAERGFYRALKELRLIERRAKAAEPAPTLETMRRELGSFLEMSKLDAKFAAQYPELAIPGLENRFDSSAFGPPKGSKGRVDVPITIGRPR